MSTHTPGPWAVAYYASQDGQSGTSHYSVKFGNTTIVKTVNQVSTGIDEANAAFIVRACNSHKAMLEALKALYKHEGETETNGIGIESASSALEHARVLAEEAIRLAEGRP